MSDFRLDMELAAAKSLVEECHAVLDQGRVPGAALISEVGAQTERMHRNLGAVADQAPFVNSMALLVELIIQLDRRLSQAERDGWPTDD